MTNPSINLSWQKFNSKICVLIWVGRPKSFRQAAQQAGSSPNVAPQESPATAAASIQDSAQIPTHINLQNDTESQAKRTKKGAEATKPADQRDNFAFNMKAQERDNRRSKQWAVDFAVKQVSDSLTLIH